MSEEFSVYWTDVDGHQHTELRFVDGEKAVSACHRLTHGPAAMLGIVERVIITDGGDCCCFEWNKEHGLIWPTPEKRDQQ